MSGVAIMSLRQAGHHQTDLGQIRLGRSNWFRQSALDHDRDAVANLEQLIEFFGDDQNGGACIAKVDQRLPDERSGPDVDAPGRL